MVSTAARVGSINVLLQTQFGQAISGLNTFASSVEGAGRRSQAAVARIDRSVLGMNRTMASINSRGLTGITVGALRASTAMEQLRGLALAAGVAVGGLVPAVLVSGMVRVADSAHRLSNQLRTVTTDSDDLKTTQGALFEVAQRTRSAFDGTVTIYARTARATEHLSLSQEKLLRITETVQKAFAIGGATTAEAWGGAVQLSQGIASDRLSGDEYRSIAENAPVLLRGMADSIGVNIGKLREMAHAGELTADVVTKAILDASAKIDADFAKTTSTIEQAWVKVGNAVTKYAMDSQNSSVASGGIVTVLNALSENIDTVADALVLIGGAFLAAFGGRSLTALQQNLSAVRANRLQVALSAAEAMKAAQAEAAANATRLASARAYYTMVTQGIASEKTRHRASQDLHKANVANLASTKALTVASVAHAAAIKAASALGMAFAAAGRAAAVAWSFIGGPIGAVMLALGAAFYVISRNAAEAEARTSRYAEVIEQVQEKSDRANGSLRRTAEEFFRAGQAATTAEAELSRQQALQDLSNTLAAMTGVFNKATYGVAGLVTAFSEGHREAETLIKQFQRGEISSEELRASLDALIRVNPGFAPWVTELMKLGDQADAERGRIDALTGSLVALQRSAFAAMEAAAGLANGGLGAKGDRPPPVLGKDRFNARFGQPYADDWKKLFPDWYKKTGGRGQRKTADDRFDNSLQELADRTAAIVAEREALNLSHAAQVRREETLKLEQEALKQVREEARRKGEQDSQNAELSQEQIDRINDKVDAYVREAMALKQAKESQEAWNTAAGEAGSILRGIIDGSLELEDVLLQLIPVIIKLMNSLNMASGGSGIFGGGWLQSFLGGLFGVSFHKGGNVGSGGNVVQFPTGAPFVGKFHGGGNFGGRRAKHDEVMALVQEHENIFTGGQTARMAGALTAGITSVKDRDFKAEVTVTGVFVDDNGVVKAVARGESIRAGAAVARKVPAMIGAHQQNAWRNLRPTGTT